MQLLKQMLDQGEAEAMDFADWLCEGNAIAINPLVFAWDLEAGDVIEATFQI